MEEVSAFPHLMIGIVKSVLRIAELLFGARQLAPSLITQMLGCIPSCPQLLVVLLQNAHSS